MDGVFLSRQAGLENPAYRCQRQVQDRQWYDRGFKPGARPAGYTKDALRQKLRANGFFLW
jgi:hypothetical protein